VVAPYFSMSELNSDKWLPVNLQMLGATAEMEQEIPVFAEIVITTRLLEMESEINEIVEAYSRRQCAGYLLWVSNFPEDKQPVKTVRAYRKVVKTLSSGERPVISLYSGFLAPLCHEDGIAGFSHGPGYGEDRDIVPVGGGLPQPKYYFTPLHRRLPYHMVNLAIRRLRWTAAEFHNRVCDCDVCKDALGADMSNFRRFGRTDSTVGMDGRVYSYAAPETRMLCNSHFIRAFDIERRHTVSTPVAEVCDGLREDLSFYEPHFGEEAAHLGVWADAFSRPL
jgi:hypothetical protein